MKSIDLRKVQKQVKNASVEKTDVNCGKICRATAYLLKKKGFSLFTGDGKSDVKVNMLQVKALLRRGLFREVTPGIYYIKNEQWRQNLTQRIKLDQFRKVVNG